MNFHTTCTHCGAKVTAYTVPMNKGMARAFLALYDAQIRLGRAVAKHELKLDNVQYTMFQKLRHFGLISHPCGFGRVWLVTMLGHRWVTCGTSITTPAGWMGGKTLADDHPAWATFKGQRKAIRITDILPEEWKQREEYVAEKVGAR